MSNVFDDSETGPQLLTVKKPKRLCVPSTKAPAPSVPAASADLSLDHFQCYDVKVPNGAPKFKSFDVEITDQFGTRTRNVKKPKSLCMPAVKNSEPSAGVALTCYELKNPNGGPKSPKSKIDVLVSNQFDDEHGGFQSLTVKKSKRVCVPSEILW